MELTNLLIDTAGRVVGTSLSPEIWLAVFVIIKYGSTKLRFTILLITTTAAVVAVRWAFMPESFRWAWHIEVAFIALAFWSVLIRAGVSLFKRLKKNPRAA